MIHSVAVTVDQNDNEAQEIASLTVNLAKREGEKGVGKVQNGSSEN